MKKILLTLASAIFAPAFVATAAVAGLSLKTNIAAAADASEGTVKVILDEDFSLMTQGSEESPLAATIEDDNLNIPSSLTKLPGWMGYYLHQAGGMIYIGLDPKEIESGVLMTPKINVSEAGGIYTVSFRARSSVKGGTDKIYIDAKDSNSKYTSREVKVTDEWQNYSLKFDNGDNATSLMLSPYLDPVYVDDIKVEVTIPDIVAPKNLSFSKYTGTGFIASWDAVEGASGYLLSVYTKDADGNREYYIEKKSVADTSYELSNLPAKQSFYYFVVQATDGVKISPESVEMVVEALLQPEILPETEVTENGFRANWKEVKLATSYNFIATLEHTAAANETYAFVNEDFANIEPLSTYYDYTSIPELPGWTIASPVFKNGEIGVNSSYGQYGDDAWIQSSIYDFSHNNGDVRIKMSLYCDHKKYTSDILVGIYTYSEADKRYKVTDYKQYKGVGKDGIEIDDVFVGGGKQSLVMIQPDGYASMMITSLEVSQELAANDEVAKTAVSMSTTAPTLKVENIALQDNDKISYRVRALGRNSTDTGTIYSDYSEPKYVELANASVEGILSDDESNITVYNLQGMKVLETEDMNDVNRLPKGIYIVNGKKIAVK